MQRRHLKFFKQEVFVGQRYRRVEDLKSLPVGFCKERGIKLILEKRKYRTLETY